MFKAIISGGGGGGSGTVTSVNVSGGTTGLTTSGGPVVGAGTITLAGVLVVASGGTGASAMLAGLVSSNGAIYQATTLGTGLSFAAATLSNTGIVLFGGVTGAITLGTGLAMTGNRLDNTGSLGTVTSVSGSGGTTGLTLTGGPITGAGTLTLGGTLVAANLANTTVAPASYGNAASSLALTIDAQGRITSAAANAIAIAAAAVSGLAASATTDTTNAANITSGLIPGARLPPAVGGLPSEAGTVTPPGTYDLGPFPVGGTVLNSYAHVVSGGTMTFTAAIGVPGGALTNITGLAALAISTNAENKGTATAANVLTADQHLWVILTNTGTPLGGDVYFSARIPS